ncbi:MAG: N-acetylmuramoyl-L-alanine amidase [Caldiserica bacterium]|jgi:N-acetylmuramoyl-L-alanine amidase|nr:N-acetylmuramoyl-L-alanine amidase [Caldisericota bacterium]MDH7562459.1 N-acetylmuramoyl-L-alanine amidase [Caldisericota bacterium]
MKIALDAGHGREGDPGAINYELGLSEEAVTSVLRELVKEKLGGDFQVFYPDRDLLSSMRGREAHEKGCEVLLSLHLNSGPPGAQGCEIWYRSGNELGKELSLSILNSLSQLPLKIRGAKSDDQWAPAFDHTWKGEIGILREFPGPACLIEVLFISDPQEARLLQNSRFLEGVSSGIVQGLKGFLASSFRFWDVSSPELKEVLNALSGRGVIKGFPDGSFHPEKPLLRGEAALLLKRLLDLVFPV